MSNKRHKPEEIVTKLRQVEVLVGQGMARIAEAMFGVPEAIEAKPRSYLTKELDEFNNRFGTARNGPPHARETR